jgi:hypothetical protein
MTTLNDANLSSQFLIKNEQFLTVADYVLDYFIVYTSKHEYINKKLGFTIELAVSAGLSSQQVKKKSEVRYVTFLDKCE